MKTYVDGKKHKKKASTLDLWDPIKKTEYTTSRERGSRKLVLKIGVLNIEQAL